MSCTTRRCSPSLLSSCLFVVLHACGGGVGNGDGSPGADSTSIADGTSSDSSNDASASDSTPPPDGPATCSADLSTDPHNCGACGVACSSAGTGQYDVCRRGTCTVATIIPVQSSLASGIFVDGPYLVQGSLGTALAMDLAAPHAVHQSSTNSLGNCCGSMVSNGRGGVGFVGSSYAAYFWNVPTPGDASAAWQVPLGSSETVAAIATEGTGLAVATTFSNSTSGRIHCPNGNVINMTEPWPGGDPFGSFSFGWAGNEWMTGDSDDVYVIQSGSRVSARYSCTTATGIATSIPTPNATWNGDPFVDATTLYIVSGTSTESQLWAMPKDGSGAGQVLFSMSGQPGDVHLQMVAVVNGTVYFGYSVPSRSLDGYDVFASVPVTGGAVSAIAGFVGTVALATDTTDLFLQVAGGVQLTTYELPLQ